MRMMKTGQVVWHNGKVGVITEVTIATQPGPALVSVEWADSHETSTFPFSAFFASRKADWIVPTEEAQHGQD